MLELLAFYSTQKLDPGSRISFDCTGRMHFDWTRMLKILKDGNSYSARNSKRVRMLSLLSFLVKWGSTEETE